jgi:hypothetical protein
MKSHTLMCQRIAAVKQGVCNFVYLTYSCDDRPIFLNSKIVSAHLYRH